MKSYPKLEAVLHLWGIRLPYPGQAMCNPPILGIPRTPKSRSGHMCTPPSTRVMLYMELAPFFCNQNCLGDSYTMLPWNQHNLWMALLLWFCHSLVQASLPIMWKSAAHFQNHSFSSWHMNISPISKNWESKKKKGVLHKNLTQNLYM